MKTLWSKLTFFLRCVHSFVKNLKLFYQLFLMNIKFYFLNIFKTKCNSVQERVKIAFSCTLYSKYLQRKSSHSSKVVNYIILHFSPRNAYTFLILVIFDRKVFKLQYYSSVTLHISQKKNNFRGEKENNFQKSLDSAS